MSYELLPGLREFIQTYEQIHPDQDPHCEPFDDSWGTWKDEQIPNTYSHYGDMLMDTLLARSINTMSSG